MAFQGRRNVFEHRVQSNLSLRPPDNRDLKIMDMRFQSHVVRSALSQTCQLRPPENSDQIFPVPSVVVIHRFDCTLIFIFFF